MEELHIAATNQTPAIDFDANKGLFSISGKSYPENVYSFYQSALEYIEEYIKNPAKETKLTFNWLYYNTATTKIIMRMIMLLKDSPTNFTIAWHYNEGFDVILEKGKEIEEVLEMEVEFKQL